MSPSLDEQLYVYPCTRVLRNRFDIRDADELARNERLYSSMRLRHSPPRGRFDLQHLQALHHHLFQDIYPWAGQLRQVPLAKGDSQFMPPDRLHMGMADIHRRLTNYRFLKHRNPDRFAEGAAEIIGDINHLHPFREGNGRTQRLYLCQLARHAGHDIDLSRLRQDQWIEASRAAHHTAYEPMARAIRGLIVARRQSQDDTNSHPPQGQTRSRVRTRSR